ncbi:ABC transporter substrate-binding protein [Agromyces sp. Soil535]|uniref:ABC transporter substrate-binding protein n=1 Tax=Agromyces sp. Soil535 TaxID=1736390 RepID=UPI000A56429D|nr:ABC transporter substrate-binding protein [Agromyces sp. Soil535]
MSAKRRMPAIVLAGVTTLALGLSGCAAGGGTSDGEAVELSFFMGNVEANVATAEGLIAAFEAANPDITIDLDSSGPSGAEGDNLTKTKLATGEMADLFWYNSGSLFQALNPDQTLLNMADEPWVDSLNESYVQTVSTDNGVYGAPAGTATGGGVFYYIPDYEELGLSVPTTWEEFAANNEALKAAGKEAVIQSYADTWTSQIFVLADYFNVRAEDPDWAEKYTAGEVKYADDPVAMAGFQHLQDVHEAGFLNQDFASATFDDALRKVANGEGTHYPMLTFAISTIADLYPDTVDDIGFFALPGDGANGLTVWMPPAIYASANTEHPEEAKRFLEFVASVDGCDAMTDAVGVSGPYLVDGCTIPDDVPRAVADMLPYFEEGGETSPALEFLSPIKGPSLEQITVEVGSGIRSAADGAALYDEDVKKQAQQLGLPGW